MKPHQIGFAAGSTRLCRHAFRFGLLFAVGLLWSGCQQSGQTTLNIDPTGVYTLATVNGSPLPTVVAHGDAQLEIRSGTFTIRADGTCHSRMLFVPPSGVEATREVTAAYTRDGTMLNLTWKGAGRTTGTIDGDTFTMNNEGMILVYRK